MSRKSYGLLLRDPRWQKLRLQIMERDGWKCRNCGASDETLNVDHAYYDGRKPWEYELVSLRTLCEACHEWFTLARREVQKCSGIATSEQLGAVLDFIASGEWNRVANDGAPWPQWLSSDRTSDEWGVPLVCPACGCDYVHMNAPIDALGEPAYGSKAGAIVITMYCETGGHEWDLVMRHHKGNSWCSAENVRKRPDPLAEVDTIIELREPHKEVVDGRTD